MKRIFVHAPALFLFISCANSSDKHARNHIPYPDSEAQAKCEALQQAEPFAVVELFSSEGCSDCPPAEELLNKITAEAMANKSYIYPLAFHIDYWNKLGWKDVFSDSSYSNRQRKYRATLRNEVVYTPQLIVNGRMECIGSDEKKARKIIDSVLKIQPEMFFSIEPKEGNINFEILSCPKTENVANENWLFCVALVQRNLESKVKRGENKGQTLHHQNIVRKLVTKKLDRLYGKIELPELKDRLSKDFSIIAFVQDGDDMKMLGANIWNF